MNEKGEYAPVLGRTEDKASCRVMHHTSPVVEQNTRLLKYDSDEIAMTSGRKKRYTVVTCGGTEHKAALQSVLKHDSD
jgi:hypothetical protein